MFDLSNETELTGVNGTGDFFFFWTGSNGTYLGHGDIVIRQRSAGTGYNGRGHVWAGYYGTGFPLGMCLMGKVEVKADGDTETLVMQREPLTRAHQRRDNTYLLLQCTLPMSTSAPSVLPSNKASSGDFF